jgi:RNA polymerase sigma-70 factor (ECF subfamily)
VAGLGAIVRNETVAEDLLSDVFLDVWRQAASFKGRASVSTWLLAIARYKALSARRARVDTELLDERITSTIADPADTPEAALQEKRRDELLRESLAKLSQHSEVIDLVYYHGKSVKEVAEIVGVGEATVKTRMFYARRKLLPSSRRASRQNLADLRGPRNGATRGVAGTPLRPDCRMRPAPAISGRGCGSRLGLSIIGAPSIPASPRRGPAIRGRVSN